jgi:hypothetical protein
MNFCDISAFRLMCLDKCSATTAVQNSQIELSENLAVPPGYFTIVFPREMQAHAASATQVTVNCELYVPQSMIVYDVRADLPCPHEKQDTFCCKKYGSSYCPICIDTKNGMFMSCCSEKQFLCFGCFFQMIFRKYGKTGKMTTEFVHLQCDIIFGQYFIRCPYCFQKAKLGDAPNLYSEVLDVLLDIVQKK